MFAIVPDPRVPGSVVFAGGNDNGVEMDVSMLVPPRGSEPPFRVRTLLRTGTRISSTGLVHGVGTDAMAVADLAASGLLLETFPTGLSQDERKDHVEVVVAQARTLARDHARWSFTPMVLDGVSYALRFRILGQGFIAHADLGDCVVAAWGTGSLPSELGCVQRVESTAVPGSS